MRSALLPLAVLLAACQPGLERVVPEPAPPPGVGPPPTDATDPDPGPDDDDDRPPQLDGRPDGNGGPDEPVDEHDLFVVLFAGARFPELPEADFLVRDADDDLAIEVLSVDPPTLHARLGATVRDTAPPQQDLCVPTVDVPDGTYDGRQFRLTLPALDLGHRFEWFDLDLSGVLETEEPDRIRAVVLRADIDVTVIARALDWRIDKACEELAARNLECVECDSGACVQLKIAGLETFWSPATSLEPMTEGDVEENPGC